MKSCCTIAVSCKLRARVHTQSHTQAYMYTHTRTHTHARTCAHAPTTTHRPGPKWACTSSITASAAAATLTTCACIPPPLPTCWRAQALRTCYPTLMPKRCALCVRVCMCARESVRVCVRGVVCVQVCVCKRMCMRALVRGQGSAAAEVHVLQPLTKRSSSTEAPCCLIAGQAHARQCTALLAPAAESHHPSSSSSSSSNKVGRMS